jgi:hypothetical protein
MTPIRYQIPLEMIEKYVLEDVLHVETLIFSKLVVLHLKHETTHSFYCDMKCVRVNVSESVAFHAYHVTDCSPLSGQTMIFSKTLLNKGDAYNTSTGIFVAPRYGMYTFEAHMCVSHQKHMRFDIMVGSTIYATAYGYTYHGTNGPTAHAIVKLYLGDRVSVDWKTWSYGISTAIMQNVNYRNSFSGKLSNPKCILKLILCICLLSMFYILQSAIESIILYHSYSIPFQHLSIITTNNLYFIST